MLATVSEIKLKVSVEVRAQRSNRLAVDEKLADFLLQ